MNAENKSYFVGTEADIEEKNQYEVTIGEIIAVVLSKFWVLILVGLIAAVGAYFYTAEVATPV